MNYENRFNERGTNGQAHTISRLPLLDEKIGLRDLIEFPHCACVNILSGRPVPALRLNSSLACKTMSVYKMHLNIQPGEGSMSTNIDSSVWKGFHIPLLSSFVRVHAEIN